MNREEISKNPFESRIKERTMKINEYTTKSKKGGNVIE